MKRESWQAPRRRNWLKTATAGSVIVNVALAGVLAWLLTRPGPPPAAPAPPAPTVHALTALENAGMQATLGRYRGANAYSMTGTITVGRNTYSIQWDTLGDSSAGTGSLKAGGETGKMLLAAGTVYLRGDQAFWTALGTTGVPPAGPGWVNIGPDFMEGKLFYPAARWTAALAPTAQSTIDGDRYTQGTATATVTGDGITALKLPGTMEVKIAFANPARVNEVAKPLIDERADAPVLQRSPSGGWTLPGGIGGEAPPTEGTTESTAPKTPTP